MEPQVSAPSATSAGPSTLTERVVVIFLLAAAIVLAWIYFAVVRGAGETVARRIVRLR